ncbi:hypothetical protein [Fulvitalea axinellae]|uniref:hypothetical protein n=1 Tax=Fulvitalea axinellae TaxID=1182444 RepID=UPI0030CA5A00
MIFLFGTVANKRELFVWAKNFGERGGILGEWGLREVLGGFSGCFHQFLFHRHNLPEHYNGGEYG